MAVLPASSSTYCTSVRSQRLICCPALSTGLLVAVLLSVLVQHSEAYSRPSVTSNIVLDTSSQPFKCELPGLSECAHAYHVEVNSSAVTLTSLLPEGSQACSVGRGKQLFSSM